MTIINSTFFRAYLETILKVLTLPISRSNVYFKISKQKTMQSERGLSTLWTSVNHIALGSFISYVIKCLGNFWPPPPLSRRWLELAKSEGVSNLETCMEYVALPGRTCENSNFCFPFKQLSHQNWKSSVVKGQKKSK